MYRYKSYSLENSFKSSFSSGAPLVSALMVTRGAATNIVRSFKYFLSQTWPNKELVIVSPPLDFKLENYLRSYHQNIKFVEQDPALNLGDYRNLAIAHSNGDYLCQWDDDDIYSPERISAQMSVLGKSKSNAVFCEQVLIWWIEKKLIFLSAKKCWENTLLCQRSSAVVYPSIARGEDTFVARSISNHQKVALISVPSLYCYTIHGENTWDCNHFDQILAEAELVVSSPEVNPHKHLEFLNLYTQNIKHSQQFS
jgi:glycosyltransferase involved in cell wall biosynthesis